MFGHCLSAVGGVELGELLSAAGTRPNSKPPHHFEPVDRPVPPYRTAASIQATADSRIRSPKNAATMWMLRQNFALAAIVAGLCFARASIARSSFQP